MSTELRDFLALSYDELEQLNLKAKEQRRNRVAIDKIREERLKYLSDEKRIKALTVLFSDLEGRLHMLDYDKKFLLKSYENLTFDGSSIRGFTAPRESDLRLGIDWPAFYLGASRRLWSRQGAGFWRSNRQRLLALLWRYSWCS
jgi:glutamine synthetase